MNKLDYQTINRANEYCKCYLCNWEGILSQTKKVEKIKGPMFGTETTGYRCPNCQRIFQFDGESMPEYGG